MNHLDKDNELGRGGYGSVYLANNLRCFGTKAAVKVLSKVSFIIYSCNFHVFEIGGFRSFCKRKYRITAD